MLKLVAFDLDGTIWSPDMYMLWGGGAPFNQVSPTHLKDRSGQSVNLLGVSGEVLDGFGRGKLEGVMPSWVSCTDEPSWADECLNLFQTTSGSTLKSCVELEMIFKANKKTHFRKLQDETGIQFGDMLFFDNEMGNIRSVSELGVKCVFCPDGLTGEAWKEGLEMFGL